MIFIVKLFESFLSNNLSVEYNVSKNVGGSKSVINCLIDIRELNR